jgi:hypothetical protein
MHIMENRFDGTDWRVLFDGVEVWSVTANNSCDMEISSPVSIAQSNQAPAFDGNIQFGEIIQYDSALGTTEGNAVRNGLAAKWGIDI